jgi:glycosyltransferase involved in cell wall biosynthesis
MKKTSVIYNFVDFSTYNSGVNSDVLREELNLSKEDVIFLCLCRVSPENGIAEVIQDWISPKIPKNAHLVIVGEMENREVKYTQWCHRLAGTKRNIHILPFRKDVPQVIASSDVSLCSFTEPHFSRAIIEGAAMGKPTVSKYIDGPKELVIENQTGLFYDGIRTKLEDCVAQMMDPQVREMMGRSAEKYALNNFNADINAEKNFAEYN